MKPRREPAAPYTAFGETFTTLRALARHERCVVPYTTLRSRIQEDWLLEDALSTPSGAPRPGSHVYTAFGETFTNLKAIAQDERCAVPYATLYARIQDDWLLEDAASTPPRARRRAPGPARHVYTAFGETFTNLKAIARHEQCAVPYATLCARMQAKWLLEDAVSTPPRAARPPRPAPDATPTLLPANPAPWTQREAGPMTDSHAAEPTAEHPSAVPPTPVGRATALREAADQFEQLLTDMGTDTAKDPRYWTGVHHVILGLRRLADEAAEAHR